jgi:nucleotide-binding universal stress UspA family protein
MGAVLLASEDRPFSPAAVELATRLARGSGGPVHVFSIARVWGTSLGLPNPGLLPTKREWEEQRTSVDHVVRRLRRRGVEASGQVTGTRSGAKRIVEEAARLDCEAIVMGADEPRNRVLANFMWSQEPYRVRRRARMPVHLVVD